MLTNNVSSKFDQQVEEENPLEDIDESEDPTAANDRFKIPEKSGE